MVQIILPSSAILVEQRVLGKSVHDLQLFDMQAVRVQGRGVGGTMADVVERPVAGVKTWEPFKQCAQAIAV